MPTSTFPLSDPAFIGGTGYIFNFTGTKCEANWFVSYGTLTLTWSVDGGAEQTHTEGVHSAAYVDLTGTIAEGTHTVWIRLLGFPAGLDPTDAVRVTGASPALSIPFGYSNNQFDNTAAGVVFDLGSNDVYQGFNTVPSIQQIRFKATTSFIRMVAQNVNGPNTVDKMIAVVIDDDIDNIQFSTLQGGFGYWGWSDLFTGWDADVEHEFRVIPSAGGGRVALIAMDDSGTLNSASLTAFPLYYQQGDSTTSGVAIDDEHSLGVDAFLYAILARRAVGMEGYNADRATSAGIAHKNNPFGDEIGYQWGINDVVIDDQASWDSAVNEILTACDSNNPSSTIVWWGIKPVSSARTDPDYAPFNASAASIATGFGANVTFGEMDSLSPVAETDGQHPQFTENKRIARHMFAYMHPATTYTAEESDSTGPTGTPVTLTFRPDLGTEGVTVTPQTDLTGSFSPSSVELIGGADVTIDFTPTIAGTHTLSFTNDGTLSDPINLTFEANEVTGLFGNLFGDLFGDLFSGLDPGVGGREGSMRRR